MSAAPSSRGIPTQLDVSREHHGASLLDFLDAVAGPLDRRLVNRAARDEQLKLNGEPVGPDYAGPLARQYFNMRKLSIYGGSNEIQKNIVAKAMLGL